MAYLQSLPTPYSLDMTDSNLAEKWNEWKQMWLHYSVAEKVNCNPRKNVPFERYKTTRAW